MIIITKKKGKSGKINISFNAYTGVSQLTGYPRVMGPEEYKTFRRESNRTTGNWTSEADDSKIFGNLLNNKGTYWPDIFLKDGRQSDYQLGISTGTDKTNVYVSLGLFNEKGLFEKDELNRYSIRANIDHKISKVFSIGTQNQITYYDQDFRNDPLTTANKLVPLEEPYDAEGNIIPIINNGRNINPLTDVLENNWENNSRINRVFTSAYVSVNLLDNLSFKSNLGMNLTSTREGLYAGSQTNFRNGAQPLARYIAGNSVGLNLENILNYKFNVNKHSFVLSGVQWLNLPAKDKMSEPHYQGIPDKNIPSAELPDGAGVLRLIAGDYDGMKGAANTFTAVSLWDLRLKGGKNVTLSVPVGHNAFLLVLSGRITVNGVEEVQPTELVQFSKDGAADLLCGGGG